jgi:sugar (pentulose or hexulose) kinase
VTKYVLAIDLGTSSIHCVLVDLLGQALATSRAPLKYYRPENGPSLAREFRPAEVMADTGRLVRETCRRAGIEPQQVAAVGVTSQGHGMVLLGKDGGELYAGPNIDLRAVFEGTALDEKAGPEIYGVTGHCPSLLMAPARLRWIGSHQPALLELAGSVVSLAGWLGYRLTGHAAAEPGLDGTLGLLDISTRQHALQLLETLSYPVHLLTPLFSAEAGLASLRPEIAEDWGLPRGLPVTIAGTDTQCGLLGMGLTKTGQVGAVLGWSGSVQMLASLPHLDVGQQRTWSNCYVIGDGYTVEANLGDVGHAYHWLTRTLAGGNLSYTAAEELAEQACPGGDGVFSFLGAGPLTAHIAGLRMGGIIMPTPLTFQESTPAQILRSYLESVAYSIKANLETVSEVTAGRVSRFCLAGGMARSGVLTSTLADLLQMPVHRARYTQVSAMGAAAAAWVSAGEYSCLVEAVAEQRPKFDVLHPTPARSGEYLDYYHRWTEMFHQLSLLN